MIARKVFAVTRTEQDSIVRNNTTLFVRNVQHVFKDMADVDLYVLPKVQEPVSSLHREHGMVVVSHFSGMVQGDFMFSTNEETAAEMARIPVRSTSGTAVAAAREAYAGFMCEALNTCVHLSIGDLEEMFGALTILPPAWIFGEYHSADYISGVGVVSGVCGTVTCSMSLNLISLQIVENLMSGKVY